jgi:hypothetical protein
MKAVQLPLPEMFAIAGTRVILGAGLALLFCHRLSQDEQHRLGTILTAVGIASTFPLAYDVLCRRLGD